MRWYEKPEVLDYMIECYAGTEGRKRQFIWETAAGDVVIGNARAFSDHVSDKFGLHLAHTSWSGLHEAMRMLGEVAVNYSPRAHERGGKEYDATIFALVVTAEILP
jgi:hypothetical protein